MDRAIPYPAPDSGLQSSSAKELLTERLSEHWYRPGRSAPLHRAGYAFAGFVFPSAHNLANSLAADAEVCPD
ncbi:MAG TPA: hypothetical protein VF625_03250 [Longimicrobium sp.]